MSPEPRVLVAAFGHAWLRDQAFGVKVVSALRARGVPEGVDLEDWSFGTIAAFQKLTERRYDRAVFVSGKARGRAPGTLHRFRPPVELPSADEIHRRIGDCVMGCVDVDNLLIIGTYYGRLPSDVVYVEAEPVDDTWSDALSPELSALLSTAVGVVIAEIERSGDGDADGLPSSTPAVGRRKRRKVGLR